MTAGSASAIWQAALDELRRSAPASPEQARQIAAALLPGARRLAGEAAREDGSAA